MAETGTTGLPAAAQIDWQVREVMVGVLHNAGQLEKNLAHRFYHMPAKLLSCRPDQVGTVALYQSKHLFGEHGAGVRHYGQVTGWEQVARGEIKEIPATRNLEEPYIRFTVGAWQQLERSIRVGGIAPGVSMFTNSFLLRNSRYFPELYIRGAWELELYTLLRRTATHTRKKGGSQPLPTGNGNTVLMAGNVIGVYTVDGRYDQYNLRDFYYQPHSFLQTIAGAMAFPRG